MEKSSPPPPLLMAVTGASGTIYSVKFLELMQRLDQEVHLILSDAGAQVVRMELGSRTVTLMKNLAATVYGPGDFAAPPASGSAFYRAMVILPCTMGTLAAVAHGLTQNLIHRAADCFLKEKRPLVLAVRETPFNRTHLKNMLAAHDSGATIFPSMPSFYHHPENLDEMALFFAGRIADFLGFEMPDLKRWNGENHT